MKTEIIPSVFATTLEGFDVRFRLARKLHNKIHVDIMDGFFVESESPGISLLPNFKGAQVHLMVDSPEDYIKYASQKKAKSVIFHIETSGKNAEGLIKLAHKLKMKAFIAINPETSIGRLKNLTDKADGFLIMGVHPGKEKQSIDRKIFERIKFTRNITNKPIMVDGGVKLGNIKKLSSAGANVIISGSYIFNSKNPKTAYSLLLKSI